jgi:hypothetical protein
MQDWGELGPERLTAFWMSIPCVGAQTELEIALRSNESKRCTRNDLADLNALGIAIPACDIVVTEKFWAHCARVRKVDTEFETLVLADLKKRPAILNQNCS